MVVRYVSHKALPHSLVAPEGAGGFFCFAKLLIEKNGKYEHMFEGHLRP